MSAWVLWDTVSMAQSVIHNSKYNFIIFYTLIASSIAPFISAYTIKDGDNGINGEIMIQ